MASKLRVNQIEPVNGIPTGGGGGIIQVKMTQTINSGSQYSTGSGTYVDVTGYNCSITPTSTTSKILVTLNPIFLLNNGSGTSQRVGLKLLRDAPAAAGIATAANTTELKAQWDTSNLGTSPYS